MAELYHIDHADITFCGFFEAALAFKFTRIRRDNQGGVGERDTFVAQQHAPLFTVQIPAPTGPDAAKRSPNGPDATPLDPRVLRDTYNQFPTGAVAIAAEINGSPTSLAAISFAPVSIEPPLVAFCIQNTSSTWPILQGAPYLGVSVLGTDHDVAARTLARKTGNRFHGLTIETAESGAVFIRGAGARLETSITGHLPAGDHTIVLLRVHTLTADTDIDPLVFHGSRFRQLLDVPVT